MNTFEPNDATPAELVAEVKKVYGMTWTELGEQIGRSEKMMRKVLKGETSGESFREALTELYNTGKITKKPQRRRAKDGHIVPVRAKRGAKTTTITPKDPAQLPPRKQDLNDEDWEQNYKDLPDAPKRGRFKESTTNMADGGRIHEIDLPKSPGKGRDKGLKSFVGRMVKISRSQAKVDKRAKVKITYDVGNGKTKTVQIGSKGGYHVSDIVADFRNITHGNVESWAYSQVENRYEEYDLEGASMIKIEITEFNASRSKDERKSLDEVNARRWNRTAKGKRIQGDGDRWRRRRGR